MYLLAGMVGFGPGKWIHDGSRIPRSCRDGHRESNMRTIFQNLFKLLIRNAIP
jgi:hypothetical protein